MKSTEHAPGSVPRFLLAGVFNTALTYAIYVLLLRFVPYAVAFTLAYVMGILVSYALNARFVFRRQASWKSFVRFPFVYVAQYLAGLLLVSLLVEWLSVPAWLAPVAALAVTIPLTYVLSRAVFSGARPT
ncbi:MAG: GtrA family protein [Burkholderiales bacterium]